MAGPPIDPGSRPTGPTPTLKKKKNKKWSKARKAITAAASSLVLIILGAVAAALITPERVNSVLGLSDDDPPSSPVDSASSPSESGPDPTDPVEPIDTTADDDPPPVEPVPRLQNDPPAVDSDGVVTTIERIDELGDMTEVELSVQNNLGDTTTLPRSSASLAAADGTTLTGEPFEGTWAETLPPGGFSRGTIVFEGALPSGVTTATFSFSTVFVQGPYGPSSIVVPGLEIAAIPAD